MFHRLAAHRLAALTASAALAVAALPARAEEQIACDILGCETVSIEVSPFANADSFTVQQVWSVVNDIIGVSGLAPNFQVVETTEVGNAAAVVIEGERYLAFNPVWMGRYKDNPEARWQLYAVMAHEVGHHLQGHTLTGLGSRPPTELEADEYAGFTLAALGATLPQAQSLFNTLSETGSATHPPRHQRLTAVQRGWERGSGRSAPNAPAPAAQAPAPAPAQASRPIGNGESCQRSRIAGVDGRVCVSSYLPASGGNAYDMGMAIDGSAATAWVEGAGGHGTGHYIAFDFDRPTQLQRFDLINGYAKSDRTFSRNSRVAVLMMTGPGGLADRITLIDNADWQGVDISDLPPLSWMRFEIVDVFPGTHYTDTAISEFRLR